MAVSECEKWLQDHCRALRENCQSFEEARLHLPDVIKACRKLFEEDYYEIPGYAEDILEEEFE